MPRRRAGKKIDFTHWTGFNGTFAAQASGSLALNIGAAQHESETLLRTRGSLVAWIDGLEAPAVAVQVSIGMLIVPEGTGATVLSTPFTNPDSPWFWYETFVTRSPRQLR